MADGDISERNPAAPLHALAISTGVSFSTIARRRESSNCAYYFVFIFQVILLVILKVYFLYLLLDLMTSVSKCTISIMCTKVCGLLMSAAAVAASESMWGNEEKLIALTNSKTVKPSLSTFSGRCKIKYAPYALILHIFYGMYLYLSYLADQRIAQGGHRGFDVNFMVSILAGGQVNVSVMLYLILCLYVESTICDINRRLKASKSVVSLQEFQDIHEQYENCLDFMSILDETFFSFLLFWFAYVYSRMMCSVYMSYEVLFLGVSANARRIFFFAFEMMSLIMVCATSEMLKTTVLSPVQTIKQISMSRRSNEVKLHLEIQKLLHRLDKHSFLSVFGFLSWTRTIVIVVVAGLLLMVSTTF